MSERDGSDIKRLWIWIFNRFWVDQETNHYISEPLYVGSDSFRHWFQKYNGFGLNYGTASPVLLIFLKMLEFNLTRNKIKKSDSRDKIVLDVGCGTGILSMFAAQAGAKKVIGKWFKYFYFAKTHPTLQSVFWQSENLKITEKALIWVVLLKKHAKSLQQMVLLTKVSLSYESYDMTHSTHRLWVIIDDSAVVNDIFSNTYSW